ncbi:hypothetical protein ACO2Q8_25835 [Larkinella sp. VNQ87]|uniref:hypothetical protein n=1 Tax=Larkinella sp. VNQ87 TaxID=3400921 RepID=UPI003C040477
MTLSKRLQIEKSALSRDVQLLQRKGWLTDSIREGLFLTEYGNQVAEQCQTIWQVLHRRIEEQLGKDTVQALAHISRQLFELKTEKE